MSGFLLLRIVLLRANTISLPFMFRYVLLSCISDRRVQNGVRERCLKTKEDFAAKMLEDLLETFSTAGVTTGECVDVFLS